jgi:predicted RNA-binding protein with EMAP domain
MGQDVFSLKQIEREAEHWKIILGFLQQENIVQKNKLAETLKEKKERTVGTLETAEQYQTRFLQQDETFRLMRNDIVELEKIVTSEEFNHNNHWREIKSKETKLAREIETLEKNYNQLSAEFTIFLLGVSQLYY